MAAVFFGLEHDANRVPTGRMIAYREYHPATKREVEVHARAILQGEPRIPLCAGGSKSEDEWRARFAAAGLPIRLPPINDVEVGIDTVYATIVKGQFLVMDHLTGLLDELASYSRVLDPSGETTDAIEDKSDYHYLDCVRGIVTYLKRGGTLTWDAAPDPRARSMMSRAPEGVFGRQDEENRKW